MLVACTVHTDRLPCRFRLSPSPSSSWGNPIHGTAQRRGRMKWLVQTALRHLHNSATYPVPLLLAGCRLPSGVWLAELSGVAEFTEDSEESTSETGATPSEDNISSKSRRFSPDGAVPPRLAASSMSFCSFSLRRRSFSSRSIANLAFFRSSSAFRSILGNRRAWGRGRRSTKLRKEGRCTKTCRWRQGSE